MVARRQLQNHLQRMPQDQTVQPRDLSAAARAAERRRISVVWALVANFGGLLLIAMLAVFGLVFLSASANTIDLLRGRAEDTVTELTSRLRDHLDLPRHQVRFIATAIEQRRIALANPVELERYIEGAISGLPQLRAISWVDASLRVTGAERTGEGVQFRRFDLARDKAAVTILRELERGGDATWSAPTWRPQIKTTAVTVIQPARRGGQLLGFVVALISVEEISTYVARLGQDINATAFILYGRDRVLGHANLREQIASLSEESPLPMLTEVGDAVLAAMWDERFRRGGLFTVKPPIENHTLVIAGEAYPFVYTSLSGYSDKPLLVGAYIRGSDFGFAINRLVWSFIAGAVGIILAVVLAVLIGRRLARPVRRFSAAAALIGELRVGEVQPLPRSRIRELDEQARAFNSMIGALRWFEAYVPKQLARHLLRSGDTRTIESDHRNLTVLFTDIVAFSTWSQDQTAAEVAELLNQHFGIVTRCIEDEGGVVDKFIGDCVMAYWGAPEKMKQRAERACRAALAVRAAIIRDNAERVQRGLLPVRMRIGIHTGDATVGNIGAKGRLNYTIIGDMVNVGQRIEQLAKELVPPPDEDVSILISEATRADLGPDFVPRRIGKFPLRGREGEMEIFAL